jgi:PST family polysaccharide transporter
MVLFGFDILTFNIVNFFARSGDNALIGWRWGAESLGLYDKAYSLLLSPISRITSPFNSVAVPTLSRMAGQPERLARTYCKMIELVSAVSFPVLFAVIVFAEDIVLLWLGPAWLGAVELFRLLSVAAVCGACLNTSGTLLIALGQTKRYKWVGLCCSLVILTAFAVGVSFGAAGVATAYSVAQLLVFFPAWGYVLRETPVTGGDVARAFRPAFIASGLAALTAYALKTLAATVVSRWPAFGFSIAMFGVAYVSVLLLGFRRWSLYREVLEAVGLKRFGRGTIPTSTN